MLQLFWFRAMYALSAYVGGVTQHVNSHNHVSVTDVMYASWETASTGAESEGDNFVCGKS